MLPANPRSKIQNPKSAALGLLVGVFLVLLGAGGIRQSLGVFIHPLEDGFGGDRAQVALVAAISFLIFGVVQPLAGWAIDRRGPGVVVPLGLVLAAVGAFAASAAGALWQVGVLYGLVASAGFGAVTSAPLSGIVARHFTARRGLALALCSSGSPLGQMLFAPAIAVVIAEHGWRVAMSGLGVALVVVVLPLGWIFLRREPPPASGPVAPLRFSGVREALGTRSYRLLAGAYVICGITTLGLVHTHLVPYALELGISEIKGAQALGLVGLSNIVGLVLAGLAGDRWGPRVPLATVYGCRSLALLWMALAADEQMLAIFALIFGLTDMATIPLTAGLTANLFGRQAVGALFGLAAVGHMVGSAVGAWLAGLGFTLLGSYHLVILVAAALAIAAALMAASLDPRAAPRAASAGR